MLNLPHTTCHLLPVTCHLSPAAGGAGAGGGDGLQGQHVRPGDPEAA